MTDRRAFLKLLAASPLLAGVPYIGQALAQTPTLQGIDSLVASAPDALDVFDLEAVARRNIPPAHWGYLAAGVDGEETLRANQQAFSRYQLHTKRFVDLGKMGMSLDLFGNHLTRVRSSSARLAHSARSTPKARSAAPKRRRAAGISRSCPPCRRSASKT